MKPNGGDQNIYITTRDIMNTFNDFKNTIMKFV